MLIKNKEVKGIIFDFDGTLVDSWGVWAKVDIQFFAKRGLQIPVDYADKIGHMGLDKAAEYTINTFNLKETKLDVIKEWKTGVVEEYATNVEFKNGAIEFLNKLNENNIPFVLATANDLDCVEATLNHYNISNYFKKIYKVADFKGKDHPDIYLEAASYIGIEPSDVMVFEDMLIPIQTAKSASFMTCAVNEKSTFRVKDNKTEVADIYIDDFTELLNN